MSSFPSSYSTDKIDQFSNEKKNLEGSMIINEREHSEYINACEKVFKNILGYRHEFEKITMRHKLTVSEKTQELSSSLRPECEKFDAIIKEPPSTTNIILFKEDFFEYISNEKKLCDSYRNEILGNLFKESSTRTPELEQVKSFCIKQQKMQKEISVELEKCREMYRSNLGNYRAAETHLKGTDSTNENVSIQTNIEMFPTQAPRKSRPIIPLAKNRHKNGTNDSNFYGIQSVPQNDHEQFEQHNSSSYAIQNSHLPGDYNDNSHTMAPLQYQNQAISPTQQEVPLRKGSAKLKRKSGNTKPLYALLSSGKQVLVHVKPINGDKSRKTKGKRKSRSSKNGDSNKPSVTDENKAEHSNSQSITSFFPPISPSAHNSSQTLVSTTKNGKRKRDESSSNNPGGRKAARRKNKKSNDVSVVENTPNTDCTDQSLPTTKKSQTTSSSNNIISVDNNDNMKKKRSRKKGAGNSNDNDKAQATDKVISTKSGVEGNSLSKTEDSSEKKSEEIKNSKKLEKNKDQEEENDEEDKEEQQSQHAQAMKEYLSKLNNADPNRITNPLLSLPPFPSVQNPSLDIVPSGAEFWPMMDLYFPKPKTFPMAYLARLLGFNKPPTPPLDLTTSFSSSKDEENQSKSAGQDEIKASSKEEKKSFNLDDFQFVTSKPSLDPFLDVPSLGWYQKLWRNNAGDDNNDDAEKLDYVDASWTTLIKEFRGFGPEAPFKAANDVPNLKDTAISSECVNLAKSHHLVNNEFTFRFAQEKDHDAIVQFWTKHNPDTPYEFHSTRCNDFKTVLRSSYQKIMLLETKDKVILAFIHYTYQWYMFGPRVATSYEDDDYITPELVFCVHRIVLGSDIPPISPDNLNSSDSPDMNGVTEVSQDLQSRNTKIVLLTLALQDARLCGIWFGLLESLDENEAELYSKIFRMKILPSFNTPVKKYPLACDIIMWSYRYTFLMLQQIQHRDSPPSSSLTQAQENGTENNDSTILKERMMIHLPTAEHAKKSFHTSSTSQGSQKCIIIDDEKTQNKDKEEASSTIRVRLKKDVGKEEDEGQNFRVMSFIQRNSNLKCNDGDAAELESNFASVESSVSESNIPSAPSWRVLKSFTPFNKKRKYEPNDTIEVLEGSSLPSDQGSIHAELIQKQKEMLQLEKSLEPQLWSLLRDVVKEEEDFTSDDYMQAVTDQNKAWNNFSAVLAHKHEAELAWQKQMEQDMDAVCDVCCDGEVTIDNQILFCESCNVAVHQKCYGIETVPEGDYFCKACRFFKRDKAPREPEMQEDCVGDGKIIVKTPKVSAKTEPIPLPIVCELCPRNKGAFVRVKTEEKTSKYKKQVLSRDEKWVHVVCAKWQGLQYIDPPTYETIESVDMLRSEFAKLRRKCVLCKINYGAMNKCSKCNNYVHVTCARSSGLCTVIHGEDSSGPIQDNAWTLHCPECSDIVEPPSGSVSLEELEATAKSLLKANATQRLKNIPFEKMNHKQRTMYLSNAVNEEQLIEKISRRLEGTRCTVCNVRDDGPDPNFEKEIAPKSNANQLVRCQTCDVIIHLECYVGNLGKMKEEERKNFQCDSCKYSRDNKESKDFEEPECHMCNSKHGSLKKAFAIPASKKNWAKKKNQLKKTLFGKQIWCHAVCGMWHPHCKYINQAKKERFDSIDCTGIVMANGKQHTTNKNACELCGHFAKAKVVCSTKKCGFLSRKEGKYTKYGHYHVSCARQAGLEVADVEKNNLAHFELQCFTHKRAEFAFRAKLEDLLEIERTRSGLNFEDFNGPMSHGHAAKLLNFSIYIMQSLGWAWKWAEWWVKENDTWEPLLDVGQDESTMTNEELRIVDSSEESRCADARRCRLAAFGAALRNRNYDNDTNDDDRVALDRALRAVLHTKSLVGPLNKFEINFFADWLGRAYRSRSPLLGFGDDKIPVHPHGHTMHKKDNSPKFELGNRSLPGKQKLSSCGIFEEVIDDIDDFLI